MMLHSKIAESIVGSDVVIGGISAAAAGSCSETTSQLKHQIDIVLVLRLIHEEMIVHAGAIMSIISKTAISRIH